MPKNTNTKGFAATELLVALAVVVVIGVVGGIVYAQNHKTKTTTTGSQTSTKTSTQSKSASTTTTPPTDPYAGWKTYCDTVNHYCFKYPATWSLDQNIVLSASKTVQVAYTNPDTRDGGRMDFTPSYLGKLTGANQDVTLVGGYYSTGGNYSPSYFIVDSSLLTTYPLTVGKQSQFVGNAGFTDKSSNGTGQLLSSPASSINSLADAQSWLNSADAKTSQQILQSFYYQQ